MMLTNKAATTEPVVPKAPASSPSDQSQTAETHQ